MAESLSSHTNSITKKCGLPIIRYDEHNQFGPDFGTRFSNALQDMFCKGYDAVIAIGSDIPNLEPRHILQAKEELERGKAAIGPTFDGGFYLLGIGKKDFDHSRFLDFSWNSAVVYDEIFQALSSKEISTLSLQKLRDLDHFSDIEKLNIKYLSNVVLRQLIQSINSLNQKNYKSPNLPQFQFLDTVPFNKGSPSISSL